MDFLQRVRTNYFKICVESEKTPNSQGNFKKENHIWGHHNARFQVVLQSCGHQDSVVLGQKHRSIEQNREPRNGPQLSSLLMFDKAGIIPLEKRTVSSVNGAVKKASYLDEVPIVHFCFRFSCLHGCILQDVTVAKFKKGVACNLL